MPVNAKCQYNLITHNQYTNINTSAELNVSNEFDINSKTDANAKTNERYWTGFHFRHQNQHSPNLH